MIVCCFVCAAYAQTLPWGTHLTYAPSGPPSPERRPKEIMIPPGKVSISNMQSHNLRANIQTQHSRSLAGWRALESRGRSSQ